MSTIAETVTCQAMHVPSLRLIHRVPSTLIQPGTGPPRTQRERFNWAGGTSDCLRMLVKKGDGTHVLVAVTTVCPSPSALFHPSDKNLILSQQSL
jgi:hypothetical protein